MADRIWPLYSEAELATVPQPKWLVQGHLTDGFSVLYGPPKSGKTFLALDWALRIATLTEWHGHAVIGGPVLYVSGEGSGGLHQRITAWHKGNGTDTSRLYVVPFAARLLNPDHVQQLQDDVMATGARLLVIDTLARSMAGSDENSAQDMGGAIAALDRIRQNVGCGILVVHHSGVDGTRPRGSTALFGAADTLARVDGGQDSILRLSCEGMKDARPFRTSHWKMVETGPSLTLQKAPMQSVI
jgi:RecA-family ATPase